MQNIIYRVSLIATGSENLYVDIFGRQLCHLPHTFLGIYFPFLQLWRSQNRESYYERLSPTIQEAATPESQGPKLRSGGKCESDVRMEFNFGPKKFCHTQTVQEAIDLPTMISRD